jgi:hypothetical protein
MGTFRFRVYQLSTVWCDFGVYEEKGWTEFEAANVDEAKKQAINYQNSLKNNDNTFTCILFHDPDEDKDNGFTEEEVWDNTPTNN